MTPSSWARTRRAVVAASLLAVNAVAVALLVLAVKSGVPQEWWPHTGRAFAPSARRADRDPCDLIAGPGKTYCQRQAFAAPNVGEVPDTAGAIVNLVPAGAGVTAFVLWRRRTTEQRRR